MKIEVTNKFGEHITLGQSLLRNTILGTPFFLNGAMLPPSTLMSPIGYVIGFIVFGIGASLPLYFNRRTRQSLHDLVRDICYQDHPARLCTLHTTLETTFGCNRCLVYYSTRSFAFYTASQPEGCIS
jgi:hypothetical protein